MFLNAQGSIQNGHCLVTGAGTSIQTSGKLNLTFKGAFTGNRILCAAGRASQDLNNTGRQAKGRWTVQQLRHTRDAGARGRVWQRSREE
jgi:hypothetical protein